MSWEINEEGAYCTFINEPDGEHGYIRIYFRPAVTPDKDNSGVLVVHSRIDSSGKDHGGGMLFPTDDWGKIVDAVGKQIEEFKKTQAALKPV